MNIHHSKTSEHPRGVITYHQSAIIKLARVYTVYTSHIFTQGRSDFEITSGQYEMLVLIQWTKEHHLSDVCLISNWHRMLQKFHQWPEDIQSLEASRCLQGKSEKSTLRENGEILYNTFSNVRCINYLDQKKVLR